MPRKYWKMLSRSIRKRGRRAAIWRPPIFNGRSTKTAIDSFKQALELMNKTFDADHYCVTAKTPSCDRLVQAYITLGYAYRQLKQCAPGGLGAFRKALIIRPDNPARARRL